MTRLSVFRRLLPVFLLPCLPAFSATESAAPAPVEAAAVEEAELPVPEVPKAVLDAQAAMNTAAQALKQRETELLATNEVIRAIATRRDQAVTDRETLIQNLPELKEKQEAITAAETEVAGLKAEPAAGTPEGQARLQEARRKLISLRKELNQLRFSGTAETIEVKKLRQQEVDAARDLTQALRKDARYAELRRAFNLAHLDYQRVALPLPRMPETAVQKAIEDAQGKPIESAPIHPPKVVPPAPVPAAESPASGAPATPAPTPGPTPAP